ncbi:MAG: lipopolysaccharide biosynthesis protein [Burkholderiaceae bacterium]|nr:lipopolysaccharide biosynthesis protein [Burkholderiaceae bacterium]
MSSTRRALAWSFAERYASLAINLASTLLLARLLTPAQIGLYSLCAALAGMLAIVRDLGTSEYLIQAPDVAPERLRTVRGVALLAGWSTAALLWLLAGPAAGYFGAAGVADVLRLLSLGFVLLPLTSPEFARLNRELRFRELFHLQLAGALVQAGVALGLASRGHGALSLAWGNLANVGVQTLWLARPAWWGQGWPRCHGALEVLRFGWRYSLARGIETATQSVHEPLIARQFGFASVGLFSRAYGLVDLFEQNVASAVVRVTTPVFAQAHRDGGALAERYALATAMYTGVAWPFFVAVALMAHDILLLMFGPQWVEAAPLATVLALATLPHGLYALAPQLLSATGRVQARLRMAWQVAPVHLGGLLLAAPFGLRAMACAWGITALWSSVLYARQLAVALRTSIGRLLGGCWRSAVLAALVGLSIWSASRLVDAWAPSALVALSRLGLTGLAGLLAWLAILRMLCHPLLAAFPFARKA